MAARLVADIGGTNARFALAGAGGTTDMLVLPVGGHAGFAEALDAYLVQSRLGTEAIGSAAIAAAGPRDGDTVRLTNAPWRVEGAAISARLGGVPVRVLNDLEAVALCLPVLAHGHLEVISKGAPAAGPLPMLAANVGTGFGAAVAVPTRTGWTALGTESGHMTLTPVDAQEAALLGGACTVEDAFSGPGYARLFGAAIEDGGESVQPTQDMQSPTATSRAVYSRVFGRLLGDLALATGAWGGVYLTGGVMSDLHRIIDVETMLAAFRQKGKMADRMARVPLCRIIADSPAFHALSAVEVD